MILAAKHVTIVVPDLSRRCALSNHLFYTIGFTGIVKKTEFSIGVNIQRYDSELLYTTT